MKGFDIYHFFCLKVLTQFKTPPCEVPYLHRDEAAPGATFYLTNNLPPALPPPPGPGPGLGRGTWPHSPRPVLFTVAHGNAIWPV